MENVFLVFSGSLRLGALAGNRNGARLGGGKN
jgi:hypothetical protein